MIRSKTMILGSLLLAATAAWGQGKSPGFDADACAKHCREMAAVLVEQRSFSGWNSGLGFAAATQCEKPLRNTETGG